MWFFVTYCIWLQDIEVIPTSNVITPFLLTQFRGFCSHFFVVSAKKCHFLWQKNVKEVNGENGKIVQCHAILLPYFSDISFRSK